MKKINKLLFSILGLSFLLSACGNLKNSQLNSNNNNSVNSGSNTSVQTTGQTNDNYYQGIIKNGKYLTSKTRGINVSTESNQFDIKSFSNGLLNLSKKEFPPNKYIFQEGQYISSKEAKKWLERKSSNNNSGLNPEGNSSDNPIYLQQLLEQDFLTKNKNKYVLSGMSIGLGLNSVYTYTKQQYGSVYQTNISKKTDMIQGKQMASKILLRLRKTKGISNNVPIMIALYRQSSPNSLVGGTFFAYAISKSGNSLGAWHNLNQQNEVLPVVNNEKPINPDVSNEFNTFRNYIKSFFPNLSGVTAQVHYDNGELAGMNITINTQFYSETEIISFTQFIASKAYKCLPNNVPIQINIQSVQGMQAFLNRSANSKSFYTHVFSSY